MRHSTGCAISTAACDADFGLNLGQLMFRAAHQALGGRLRLAVSGGAALPDRVAEFFNDFGLRLLEGYGLTEAAPVLSVGPSREPLNPGSVGKPLVGVEVKLQTEPGEEVGEILARGPNVMAGYYRDQAATDAALKDGWLHTGDLGRFDEQGRLYIVGRAKDVIVDAGGNNVYIDEVEEAYGHSAYIKELAVVGSKSPAVNRSRRWWCRPMPRDKAAAPFMISSAPISPRSAPGSIRTSASASCALPTATCRAPGRARSSAPRWWSCCAG